MINLLPPDIKEDLFYARLNSSLRNWVLVFGISLMGVILIIVGGTVYMRNSITASQARVDASKISLASQNPEETQKRLEEISANTKLIIQVLSREILFSSLLKQLGTSLPPDTVLQDFALDRAQAALTLKALATNYNAATQLQINLQDPKNKIFQSADIESVNCDTPKPGDRYPCTIQIRALFAKDNPFVYIVSGQSSTSTNGATP